MLKCGLVSISFRDLGVQEIIGAAAAASLGVIEWGGDVHAPHGDPAAVALTARLSRENKIATPTYGSYLRLGECSGEDIRAVLSAAERIGAATVRIWGGREATEPGETAAWQRLVDSAKAVAAEAAARGLTAALECHAGTVTERAENALAFIDAVGDPALRSYWQPDRRLSHEQNLAAAKALAPFVDCIHVFNWDKWGKYPLAQAKDMWKEYFSVFAQETSARDIPALLEFMPDGKPESLPTEAAALRDIVSSLNGGCAR